MAQGNPVHVLCSRLVADAAHSYRNMAIRVTAACTLRDLRLRGPGVATEEYWGYAYPGLVSVVGDTATEGGGAARRVCVNITGLEVRRAGTSNGIKVVGAADVTITRSSICNCQRNGIIVQVRSHCWPGLLGVTKGLPAQGCLVHDSGWRWVAEGQGEAVSRSQVHLSRIPCSLALTV